VTDDHALIWRSRRRLILIFLLFFGPLLAAWLLILNGWRPLGTTNHGTLVQPPAPVAELPLMRGDRTAALGEGPFLGRWSMLLVLDGPCDDACLYTLDRMVRVRVALNKDADRVQMLLVLPEVVPAPQLPPGGPDLLRLPRGVAAELAEAAPAAGGVPSAVHLVDPYGFRMMRYSPPLDAQGLLKDLRRLLRLSDEEIERLQRLGRDK
jgi:hypothetical protein